MSFHLLVPLLHFALDHVLPLTARLRGVWTSFEAGFVFVNNSAQSYKAYSSAVLNVERARDVLDAVNTVIRLADAGILREEVLLLSLLRTESFLQRTAPAVLQSAHVGCAGVQDQPDLFVSMFHALEKELGAATHLLKLMEARKTRAHAAHLGLDAAM